jgi:hypothetical protein
MSVEPKRWVGFVRTSVGTNWRPAGVEHDDERECWRLLRAKTLGDDLLLAVVPNGSTPGPTRYPIGLGRAFRRRGL